MPTRHGGRPAKSSSTLPRASFLRSTGRPCASAPCTWNQLFAKSRPMVVISATDGLPVVVVLTPGTVMPKAGTVHSMGGESLAIPAAEPAQPAGLAGLPSDRRDLLPSLERAGGHARTARLDHSRRLGETGHQLGTLV